MCSSSLFSLFPNQANEAADEAKKILLNTSAKTLAKGNTQLLQLNYLRVAKQCNDTKGYKYTGEGIEPNGKQDVFFC